MAGSELDGWIKMHRRMLQHPIWGKPSTFRVWVWVLTNAAHKNETVWNNNVRYDIKRGQLVASIAEAAAGAIVSAKAVRCAFEYLAREKMIVRDKSLITVVNYSKYQDKIADDSPHGEEEPAGAQNDVVEGQDLGQELGQGKNGKRGKAATGAIPFSGNGKRSGAKGGGARQNEKQGHDLGQDLGQTINKEEEVKKLRINPPYPPSKKGGRVCDNSSALVGGDAQRLEAVLGMWRDARKAGGLDYQEDRGTTAGAKILARDYLACARLSVGQLRDGMASLVRRIKSDPKCWKYDLRTLANNPSKYCPPPPIEKIRRKLVAWRLECDVCGHSAMTAYVPEGGEPPPAQPCGRSDACQGTMVVTEVLER